MNEYRFQKPFEDLSLAVIESIAVQTTDVYLWRMLAEKYLALEDFSNFLRCHQEAIDAITYWCGE